MLGRGRQGAYTGGMMTMQPRLIRTARERDDLGWTEMAWSDRLLASLGLATLFTEDRLDCAEAPFTLRGLHFQRPPHAQARLLRVLSGRAMAVLVDLRRGSGGFGRQGVHLLDAETPAALFVPEGFAVGTMTLLPKTLLLTRFSAPVVPAARSGLLWNDPALGITWPLMGAVPVMEAADRALPRLAEIDDPFPD